MHNIDRNNKANIRSLFRKEYKSCPLKDAFMVRVIHALEDIMHNIDEDRLSSLLASATDIEVLLSTINLPEAAHIFLISDPLASAKLRGIALRKSLLEYDGGCYSATQAAEHLHISRQAVDKRRKAGKLLAIKISRDYMYPAWQFSQKGIIDGLEEVLLLLDRGNNDPWAKLAFFLTPDPKLDNKTPLSVMPTNIEFVKHAALTYGTHGA